LWNLSTSMSVTRDRRANEWFQSFQKTNYDITLLTLAKSTNTGVTPHFGGGCLYTNAVSHDTTVRYQQPLTWLDMARRHYGGCKRALWRKNFSSDKEFFDSIPWSANEVVVNINSTDGLIGLLIRDQSSTNSQDLELKSELTPFLYNDEEILLASLESDGDFERVDVPAGHLYVNKKATWISPYILPATCGLHAEQCRVPLTSIMNVMHC